MQNQFLIIQPWIPQVLAAIKRELRTDHLPNSPAFARSHFGNRPLNRLTAEELFRAYEKDLLAGNEELSEWVVNRWVFKNGDLYAHFAEGLERIDADYDALKSLTEEQSEQILQGALERFGALSTYLFSVLNRVVFPQMIFDRLRQGAEREESIQKMQAEQTEQQQNISQMKERYEKTIASLQDKCDRRIAGVMKKYTTDTEALKKQIRALQQQLQKR